MEAPTSTPMTITSVLPSGDPCLRSPDLLSIGSTTNRGSPNIASSAEGLKLVVGVVMPNHLRERPKVLEMFSHATMST